MIKGRSYEEVMSRRHEIVGAAVGIDYAALERNAVAFDYDALMGECGLHVREVLEIQRSEKVGNTPLVELRNLTRLARRLSEPGCGARILLKDEAANPSGSFKARRASLVLHQAQHLGYRGVIAATSGNYGSAVASQAAMRGLDAIILQEVYDSAFAGQPEILEKARACAAYGAEVWLLTVGPELFYLNLLLLEETGYFNASLYTPYAIAGIETLGYEIARQCRDQFDRDPDVVVVTHAGGGNVTGTARGLAKAGVRPVIMGASVDLSGLHMASDRDFNRKSFTTGHTGFGVPFLVNPDRVDVPRNAARALRYLDRYVTVTQGEVFYMTEALAALEGLERGPAGNTSLAAAFALAREMGEEELVVVQESEYTGAGKHPTAQLTFAREMGVDIRRGHPRENVPGKVIAIPEAPSQLSVREVDLGEVRRSYLRSACERLGRGRVDEPTVAFLAEDTNMTAGAVIEALSHVMNAAGKPEGEPVRRWRRTDAPGEEASRRGAEGP